MGLTVNGDIDNLVKRLWIAMTRMIRVSSLPWPRSSARQQNPGGLSI